MHVHSVQYACSQCPVCMFTVPSMHTYMSSSNGRVSYASGYWWPAQTHLHRRMVSRKVRILVTNMYSALDCYRTEQLKARIYATFFLNYSKDGGSQHLRRADIAIAASMASYSKRLNLQYDIPWRASIFGLFGFRRQMATHGRITWWTGSDLELSGHEVTEVLSRNLPDDIKKVKVQFTLEQAAKAQG